MPVVCEPSLSAALKYVHALPLYQQRIDILEITFWQTYHKCGYSTATLNDLLEVAKVFEKYPQGLAFVNFAKALISFAVTGSDDVFGMATTNFKQNLKCFSLEYSLRCVNLYLLTKHTSLVKME